MVLRSRESEDRKSTTESLEIRGNIYGVIKKEFIKTIFLKSPDKNHETEHRWPRNDITKRETVSQNTKVKDEGQD